MQYTVHVIGAQLARESENEVLVPHVEEIKRMKRLARREKTAPQTLEPQAVR